MDTAITCSVTWVITCVYHVSRPFFRLLGACDKHDDGSQGGKKQSSRRAEDTLLPEAEWEQKCSKLNTLCVYDTNSVVWRIVGKLIQNREERSTRV